MYQNQNGIWSHFSSQNSHQKYSIDWPPVALSESVKKGIKESSENALKNELNDELDKVDELLRSYEKNEAASSMNKGDCTRKQGKWDRDLTQ